MTNLFVSHDGRKYGPRDLQGVTQECCLRSTEPGGCSGFPSDGSVFLAVDQVRRLGAFMSEHLGMSTKELAGERTVTRVQGLDNRDVGGGHGDQVVRLRVQADEGPRLEHQGIPDAEQDLVAGGFDDRAVESQIMTGEGFQIGLARPSRWRRATGGGRRCSP